MRHVFLSLGAAIGLVACAPAPADISVTDASLNPPLGGRTVGAAYMTISNAGGPTDLVAATSPETDIIELHMSSRENGIARMDRLDVIPVPTGDTVLEQGGLHLMLFGLTADEASDGVEIVLEFADGTSRTVTAR